MHGARAGAAIHRRDADAEEDEKMDRGRRGRERSWGGGGAQGKAKFRGPGALPLAGFPPLQGLSLDRVDREAYLLNWILADRQVLRGRHKESTTPTRTTGPLSREATTHFPSAAA